MATGSKSNKDRAERERARLYAARTQLHEAARKRRVRDNIIAGVVGGILLLGAIGAQVAYFSAGPGVLTPTPTLSPTQVPDLPDIVHPSTDPSATPAPEATDSLPSPSPTK